MDALLSSHALQEAGADADVQVASEGGVELELEPLGGAVQVGRDEAGPVEGAEAEGVQSSDGLMLDSGPTEVAGGAGADQDGPLAVGEDEDCHGSQETELLEEIRDNAGVHESQDSAAAGDVGDQCHVPEVVKVVVEQPQPDSALDSTPDTAPFHCANVCAVSASSQPPTRVAREKKGMVGVLRIQGLMNR